MSGSLEKEQNVFFIADLHFGHENIIGYENRPFESVEKMDQVLIERWNSVVKEQDVVYVLGDFSFYDIEKTTNICRKLKGRKILVLGNHDELEWIEYCSMGFAEVSRYPIIIDGFWMLSHEPLYINGNMPYANIFGHVHGNVTYGDYSIQSYCVSVERIDYTPIQFEQIKKNMGL